MEHRGQGSPRQPHHIAAPRRPGNTLRLIHEDGPDLCGVTLSPQSGRVGFAVHSAGPMTWRGPQYTAPRMGVDRSCSRAFREKRRPAPRSGPRGGRPSRAPCRRGKRCARRAPPRPLREADRRLRRHGAAAGDAPVHEGYWPALKWASAALQRLPLLQWRRHRGTSDYCVANVSESRTIISHEGPTEYCALHCLR